MYCKNWCMMMCDCLQKTMALPMHKLCCEGSQCLMKIDYVDVAVSWQNPRVAPSSWKVSITSWWVGKSPIFHITQQKENVIFNKDGFKWCSKSPKTGHLPTPPTTNQTSWLKTRDITRFIFGQVATSQSRAVPSEAEDVKSRWPSWVRPQPWNHRGQRRIPRKQISWEKWYGF